MVFPRRLVALSRGLTGVAARVGLALSVGNARMSVDFARFLKRFCAAELGGVLLKAA
jgi:hypothetical protein